MAKKKSEPAYFGVESASSGMARRGRPANIPQMLDACIGEFLRASRYWLNRYREVWFSDGNPLLENAWGASDHKDAPNWYDEAIKLIEKIARLAAEGKEKLQKGKAEAERRLAQKAQKGESGPQTTVGDGMNTSANSEEEHNKYFGDAPAKPAVSNADDPASGEQLAEDDACGLQQPPVQGG